MKRVILLSVVMAFLAACSQKTVAATATSTLLASSTPSATLTPTQTFTLTPTVTPTITSSPTAIPMPTKYVDGTLNCPGSIALMYHTINPLPDKNTDYVQNNTDIGSFEKVIRYLVDNDFYFPTPSELAEDMTNGVCKHKYAIVTIDDSWNDPEVMGVTKVLKDAGGGTEEGLPKVWFAVITYALSDYIDVSGNTIDAWEHFRSMQKSGLVYIISHSQSHPVVKNINDLDNKTKRKIYVSIGNELLPSRKDILWGMDGAEPYFFVYPGGIIGDPILGKIRSTGYIGAFTVWAGSLDKSSPNFLPRINGGLRCDTYAVDNSFCVIEQIEKYSGE